MGGTVTPPDGHGVKLQRVVGFVSLVGAGPWDPELLTLAGRDRLRAADVVIADYLANPALLLHCRDDAVIHQREAGPRTGARLDQAKVNALMLEYALDGRHVVRLKGGDPCMFGRGAEEAQVLREHQIPYEFVPGVSSPIAAPETAGIPITHRDHTPAVSFVSGFEAYDKAGLHVQWQHLAKSAGTLVLMMSVRNAELNAAKLVEAGRPKTTPAAVIRWGTRGIQRTVVGNLGNIAQRIAEAGLRAPAVMVVGDVVQLREQLKWFEHRPLFGQRVVVTRSAHRSATLTRKLAQQGADVVVVPCIATAPAPSPQALAAAVTAANDFDGVILSSPNGVDAAVDALLDAGHDTRLWAEKTVAAIGTGTARACRMRGIVPNVVPSTARSEGLIDALRVQDLLGQRWLHVRADEGRPLLEAAITGAGGHYTLAIGYRITRPRVAAAALRSLRTVEDGGEGVDALCLTSGRAARHLLASMEESWPSKDAAMRCLQQGKIVALGPATAAAIEALGLSVARVASDVTDDAMVDAVVAALAPDANG